MRLFYIEVVVRIVLISLLVVLKLGKELVHLLVTKSLSSALVWRHFHRLFVVLISFFYFISSN